MICLEFPRRACLGAAFFHFRTFNGLVIVRFSAQNALHVAGHKAVDLAKKLELTHLAMFFSCAFPVRQEPRWSLSSIFFTRVGFS